jgi:hypothetical protein
VIHEKLETFVCNLPCVACLVICLFVCLFFTALEVSARAVEGEHTLQHTTPTTTVALVETSAAKPRTAGAHMARGHM